MTQAFWSQSTGLNLYSAIYKLAWPWGKLFCNLYLAPMVVVRIKCILYKYMKCLDLCLLCVHKCSKIAIFLSLLYIVICNFILYKTFFLHWFFFLHTLVQSDTIKVMLLSQFFKSLDLIKVLDFVSALATSTLKECVNMSLFGFAFSRV